MARAAPTLEGWMTTQEVAEHYGIPSRIVLRMIRQERLSAQKLGWQWVVHRSQLPDSWPPPINDN